LELLSALGIEDKNHRAFLAQLEETAATYESVSSLIEQAAGTTIVLSHVPPYNTEADRHHAVGNRQMELEGAHVGSIGLKLALRKYQPVAAFHGHSHNPVYEAGFDDQPVPHSLNPGFQGIVRVTVDQEGSFGYERLTDGE
jgi:Icc-related predicted phosphoesterase